MNLRNYKFNNNGQLYDIKIMYSPVQGKSQLKQYVKHKYFCEYFQQALLELIILDKIISSNIRIYKYFQYIFVNNHF